MADVNNDPPISVTKLKAVASPDTIVTPKGNVVTKAEWQKAKQNGMNFDTHQQYADWVDGWARPIADPQKSAPASKPPIQMSDKARGLSNKYYSPNEQANSPSPPSIKSNNRY